jgi:hypothetical protein
MSEEVVVAVLGTSGRVEEADGTTGPSNVSTQRRDGVGHRYKHTYESVHFDDGAITSWVE